MTEEKKSCNILLTIQDKYDSERSENNTFFRFYGCKIAVMEDFAN